MGEINHDLMKSLEFKGEYGCRYTCDMCKEMKNERKFQFCRKQGVEVSPSNNVCREFQPKIMNPSSPPFNFDDYLEFLGSDYYRPYSIDKSIINGSAKLGEVVADGGKLAKLLPNIYSYWYQYYDKPYCSIRFPRCLIKVNDHKFEIDYKRYREMNTLEKGKIHFDLHYWKDNPKQRKFQKEVYGTYSI